MVMPAMQLAAKVPDVYLQLWSASLLKGMLFRSPFSVLKGKPIEWFLSAFLDIYRQWRRRQSFLTLFLGS